MDWAALFDPSLPIAVSIVRGTVVFLALTVLMRITGQREAGALAITDLLVVVLVAEAVAHGLVSDSTTVTDGLIVVAVVLAWSVALDALAYRFPGFRKVLKPDRRPLILDGEINWRRMRREFLTREELEAQLRLHGIQRVEDVERAYLEPSGMISAFRRSDHTSEDAPHPTVH